jgi:hypothetical protein
LQRAKRSGEEDERLAGCAHTQPVYLPDHYPVVPGGMLGDDFALERGERIGEQRHAAGPKLPLGTGEAVSSSRGGAADEPFVLAVEHVPKRPFRRIRCQVSELRAGQKAISRGSSDTDVSELAIRPAGSPSGAAVINATPVANLPSASRNARVSGGAGVLAGAGKPMSVERGGFAERDVGEVVVGTVGAEGVHERARLDIAVGACERTAVDVPGAA